MNRVRVFVASWLFLLGGCGHNAPAHPPLAPGSLRGWNVLLVTIDTLRADRVGAYGSSLGLTPTLDRLAGEGVRFADAYAHVPLTLPSHATILTGTYPFVNGVRDNGIFRLDAAKPTLAKALRAAGFRTGAFVGAFVLDARYGLNAGFDTYDDRMTASGAALEVVQRPAEEVLASAAEWILSTSIQHPAPSTQNPAPSARSWFAWVHLYDPHEPYEPTEPYRSRYASDPYAGEIAYADAALGAFLDRMRVANGLARTLIVVAADHGEALGDHGERTHGLFAYNATLQVPLILWTTDRTSPAVVSQAARLVDVAPTILDLLGVDVPTGSDGRSLRTDLTGRTQLPDAPSYFEALNANLTRGWAPLRGVISGHLKLIDLPIPELYDLAADPNESRNLYAADRERARPLEAILDRFGAAQPSATTAVDPDAAARLRSLGYIVGTTARSPSRYTAADDPKRLVHLNAALDDATAMWSRGDAAQATATLRGVIAERPDMTIAYDRLAFVLRATGQTAAAVDLLDGAARAGHTDPVLLRSLGSLLRDAGNLPRSATVLEALLRLDPSDLQTADALGQTYARMHRPADAEKMFRKVIDGSPNAATTWNNLGSLYLSENRNADAVEALSRAVSINPALAGAHNGLGVAYARQGNVEKAVGEWRAALRVRPDYEEARANLEKVGAR
jgi:arylsulfatase A-like enzyme/Flp pilus assembly protein TadD